MHTFKDRAGREWKVEIDVAAAMAIRSELKINIHKVVEEGCQLFVDLLNDSILVVEVLWVLCAEQAKGWGIDEIKFGRGFAGDVIEDATQALIGEIVFFTPNPRMRETMTALVEKALAMSQAGIDRTNQKIASLQFEQLLEQSTNGFGNTPDNLALTRDHSPTASLPP